MTSNIYFFSLFFQFKNIYCTFFYHVSGNVGSSLLENEMSNRANCGALAMYSYLFSVHPNRRINSGTRINVPNIWQLLWFFWPLLGRSGQLLPFAIRPALSFWTWALRKNVRPPILKEKSRQRNNGPTLRLKFTVLGECILFSRLCVWFIVWTDWLYFRPPQTVTGTRTWNTWCTSKLMAQRRGSRMRRRSSPASGPLTSTPACLTPREERTHRPAGPVPGPRRLKTCTPARPAASKDHKGPTSGTIPSDHAEQVVVLSRWWRERKERDLTLTRAFLFPYS